MLNVPEDPRTDEQRSADRDTIASLSDTLARRRDKGALDDRVIARLVEGRSGREDYEQITVLDDGEGRQLAARGEVLIAAADLTPELRAELTASGREPEPIEDLNHVYRVPGIEPDRGSRSSFGRGDGTDVRPNFLAPMGIVMKALCGPEHTAWPGNTHPGQSPSPNPVKVAVIDTGIATAGRTDGWLSDLETRANEDRLDELPADGLLDLGAGHGTFCCGLVQWLAPAAEIRVYRALRSDGLGTELGVARAMMKAVRDGAQILNLSVGFETDDDDIKPVALKAAVDLISTYFPDVVMIAAAGNTGQSRPCWPAAFGGVTSVAGLTQSLDPAPWSTRGDWVVCSTIGEGVLSTYVVGREDPLVDEDSPETFAGPNPWALWTGTSFAAPQVTGAVAQIAENDGISPRDALTQLLGMGSPLTDFGQRIEILRPT